MPDVKYVLDGMGFVWDSDKDAIKLETQLTEAQIREIEAAQNKPAVEDEDCPELDPQKTPELWDEMMKSLAERNRKMAQRMA